MSAWIAKWISRKLETLDSKYFAASILFPNLNTIGQCWLVLLISSQQVTMCTSGQVDVSLDQESGFCLKILKWPDHHIGNTILSSLEV